ncbi:PadR family transcriptional regulator [Actinoplanes sp. NPDC049118]|uniref:PadR family transcriptional regulator n=1 Tax=Actinoplanes sp. NPDC049118 TaxID=3155769 RepID=UPI003405CB7F
MTAAMGDILLVLLSREPRSVLDLQQGYTDIFGDRAVPDVIRIVATLTRLERGGFVRTVAWSPGSRSAARRVVALTPAGQQRQRAWLLDPPPDVDRSEVYARAMLAVAYADRATFDGAIGACRRVVDRQRSAIEDRPGAVDAAGSVKGARASFEVAALSSLGSWLYHLRGVTRDRDAPP